MDQPITGNFLEKETKKKTLEAMMMTELSDSSKQFKGKLMIKNQRHRLPLGKTEMAEEQHAPDSTMIGPGRIIPTTFLPVKLCGRDEQIMTPEGHSLSLS